MLFDFLKNKCRCGLPDVEYRGSIPPPMPRLQYLPRITLFLCDGRACGDECPNPECKHTADVNHAKNFKLTTVTYDNSMMQKLYVEGL